MSKVFVIDDSISVCVAIERMLGEHGFDVIWEKDAITALNTVEKHAPDLIICDVVLPEIDGYEICRSLRANPLLNHVQVILISGAVSDEVRSRGRAAGAAAVVAKPFTTEQLIEVVQATLGVLEPAAMDAPKRIPAPALQRRMATELEALAVLGSRFACIVDRDLGIVATTGTAEPGLLAHATKQELQRLGELATAAAQATGDSSGVRLTLESAAGVRMIESLGHGHHLIVALADARSLGKTRFIIRRLRDRLTRMLGS